MSYSQDIIDRYVPRTPDHLRLVEFVAEYQRAHEDATGLIVPVLPLKGYPNNCGSITLWKFFKQAVKIHTRLTKIDKITDYYTFFLYGLRWLHDREPSGPEKIIPISIFLSDWFVKLYHSEAVDRRGNTRDRDPYLSEKTAIIGSVSMLQPLLDDGMEYKAALVSSLDVLEPEFLATDKVYLALVMDKLIPLNDRVVTFWDKMRVDTEYLDMLTRCRIAAFAEHS